jgi:Mn-dependent DtxR family transcriptional regulator
MATPPENQVIALLAKEWDMTGPPGIMDVSDIVAALPLAPSETLAALKDLFANGLIDMNKLKTSAFLTPEGYAAVESERQDVVRNHF